jgi:hypothetical protein
MTPLEARVKAANSCREVASKLYEPLTKVFTDLIGKKICKTDGTLLEKYKKNLENVLIPNTHELSIYRHHSDYSLAWSIRACVLNGNSGCYYDEVTLYIGVLNDQVLTEICPKPEFPVYSADKSDCCKGTIEVGKESSG